MTNKTQEDITKQVSNDKSSSQEKQKVVLPSKRTVTITFATLITALLSMAALNIMPTAAYTKPATTRAPKELSLKEDLGNFCGTSTNEKCAESTDCIPGGCSGQVCMRAKQQEGITTSCEWKNCYADEKYGVFCDCIQSECVWTKNSKKSEQLPPEKTDEILPARDVREKCVSLESEIAHVKEHKLDCSQIDNLLQDVWYYSSKTGNCELGPRICGSSEYFREETTCITACL
jgi:eight-cysteine-cluster-containing protein